MHYKLFHIVLRKNKQDLIGYTVLYYSAYLVHKLFPFHNSLQLLYIVFEY